MAPQQGELKGSCASPRSRVPRERLAEGARVSRTVQEYLAELEQQNPVAEPEQPPATHSQAASEKVSTTDPDAAWAFKGGPAGLAYYDNYLIDTASRVILAVEATPARFRQESLAARRMLEQVQEQFGLHPHSLGADKAYGSGEFLAWLLARGLQPHIPVIDRRHQTRGHFTREQFRYEPTENTYYCPEGKPLHYRGQQRSSQGYAYCESFNGKLRDECLNGEIFYSLQEAQIVIERWRIEYNTRRPHSALGYRPPVPAASSPRDRPNPVSQPLAVM